MTAATTRGLTRAARRGMYGFAHAPRALAFGVVSVLVALVGALPAGLSAQSSASVVISEVHPAGNSNGTYAADWFEVTNTGATAVQITGWRMDDNSNAFASAVALRGLTSIPAGSTAVFFEGTADGVTDATIIANFSTAWFGAAVPPAGFLIGAYGGAGVGMSGGGDAVNLFDAAGNRVTGVSFGAAATTAPVPTFDNSAGLGSTTLPLPVVTTQSVVGVNGAVLAFNGAEIGSPGTRVNASPLSGVDLSTYVRIGRFDLPEPTRTVPPLNSVLAQEVSAVTYNWNTDTLFVVGDRGTSIVQVSKTGALIDSMTLAPGVSPQGTDFYDPEGLTYVGGGRFVMVEERDRQAVLFTYAAGTTLTRSAAQTVDLGTFVDNIGIEGISYDPLTDGFIAVKEIDPQGIFHTSIDFAAGTATNGSPTTVNSTNLFNPALAGMSDFADVFALSNLPSLTGPDSSHLLVLSQEAGRIVNIDRNGQIFSTLTIVADPGNPLSVADHQHEGLTMDGDGVLYVVSENGGGDTDHPQLWVYAPSLVPNQAPTDLVLNNVISAIAENTSTATRLKVADVVVTDDGLGANALSVTGTDAGAFDVDSTGLYVRAGTVLDFETKASYSVIVEVDDTAVGTTPDAAVAYTLTVTDIVDENPSVPTSIVISEITPWASGNAPYAADWFEVTNTGATAVNIAGWRMDDSSNAFGTALTLNGIAGIAPGESVIFMETSDLAATRAAFLTAWFGANPPAGIQVGSYSGGGAGLSTGGDVVNLFDAGGNRITGVSFGASTTGVTFDNAAGLGSATLPLPTVSTLSVVGVNGAFVAVDGIETGSPGTVIASVIPPRLVISEVAPWGSGDAPYAADWFEVTNIGASAVNLAAWRMDDSSNAFATAVALSGIASIAPGESVIFMETATLATTRAAFLTAWFGASAPAGLQVGSYSGGGVGLSTGGDAVSLFDAGGNRITGISFGASTTDVTFDNAAGLGSATPPLPAVSTLSVVGTNGAFLAADGLETGSPGTTENAVVLPSVVISEVTPWASGNAPYEADWFEVTNTGTSAVNVAGWRMDDSSNAFGTALPLNGIVSIAPGESVIFMETADLAATRAAFLTAWFGANPPAGIQVGSYSGGGAGLSTGGDAVNLFDAGGNRITGVSFGASTSGFTFDNAAGLGSPTLPLPTVSTLSVVGVNGAFVAADGLETGSPGTIRLVDTTAPVIDPVADLVVEATGPAGAVVTYSAPATLDAVDGPGVATCLPASGSSFALGATTVTCTAQDFAGNSASTTFAVTVRDTTAPTIAAAGNIVAEATSAAGAVVAFASPTTTDLVDGVGTAACLPASGSTFALGTTTVTCSARDAAGNTATRAFAVLVRDTTPPVLTVPAGVSASTTSASGVAVSFSAASADLVDGSRPVTCTPASGTVFPIGVTTVRCTAADRAGNTGTGTFAVTVTLTKPPSTPDGRIYGIGHVDGSGKHHHFAFRVSEIGNRDFGRFEYWVSESRFCGRDDDDHDHDGSRDGHHDRDYGRDHKKAGGRFEATSITSVVFSNDPAFTPGRRPGNAAPRVDSVSFAGTGKWNGKSGYTFKATATDEGEPGRRYDTFSLVIKDARGATVASVTGDLDGGNIQSTRIRGDGRSGAR